MKFGPDYLIPKPFDPRVLIWEASAVAEAAMRTGVAQQPVDLNEYREQLERRRGKAHEISRIMIRKAQAKPKSVVFPEGENEKILRACYTLMEEKIAVPILLGRAAVIQAKSLDLGMDLKDVRIINPAESPLREAYIQELCRLRQRRGITLSEAHRRINDRNIFASMMVRMGDADSLVSGVVQNYPDAIRPALQIVRMREGLHTVAGCYVMITRNGDIYFMADTTVNVDPTAENLAEIALCAAETARRFDVVPRIAMLSFSSFGSTKHPLCEKVRKAVDLLHKADPTLVVDGEVMADIAVSPEMLEELYPFSALKGGANVLICPDLNSANIAYKLLAKVGGADTIGPILMGMSKPVHLLSRGAEVEEIVNMAAIAVIDAQELERSEWVATEVSKPAVLAD
jgi:malate dehydrogenase (oxaloacetate-decarboxylating)(NADP+)